MFWRIWWRLLRGSRARLGVAFLAIASGATVCTALINLQLDADRKLTREFRAFGANLIVSPRSQGNTVSGEVPLMDGAVTPRIPEVANSPAVVVVPFLYVTALIQKAGEKEISPRADAVRAIVSGTEIGSLGRIGPGWKILPNPLTDEIDLNVMKICFLGLAIAKHLGAEAGSNIEMINGEHAERLRVAGIITAGRCPGRRGR